MMLLNNLLAAPTFQSWLRGTRSTSAQCFSPEGAAGDDLLSPSIRRERMFFVSLFLNEVLGWVRVQPGTGSLRAIIYMDETSGSSRR